MSLASEQAKIKAAIKAIDALPGASRTVADKRIQAIFNDLDGLDCLLAPPEQHILHGQWRAAWDSIRNAFETAEDRVLNGCMTPSQAWSALVRASAKETVISRKLMEAEQAWKARPKNKRVQS